MTFSVFDLFTIGIGPSSSHTLGPMLAARRFATALHAEGMLDRVERIRVELFGSLGATGWGDTAPDRRCFWGWKEPSRAPWAPPRWLSG